MASEVNEAILKAEHADSAQSQLLSSLKLLIWAQGMCSQFSYTYIFNTITHGSVVDPKLFVSVPAPDPDPT